MKNVKFYSKLSGIAFTLLLTGYTVFTLLDAFVIPHDVISFEDITVTSEATTPPPETKPEETEMIITAATTAELKEPIITDNSYESKNFSVTITQKRLYDTEIYVADVIVKDISYFKAGLADGSFGRNLKQTTSEMATACDAVFAVNGDYYGFRDSGFVMRNGYLYRNTSRPYGIRDALVVYKDGRFEIVDEAEANADDIANEGAFQIFTFGPALINSGVISVDENSEVEQSMTSNPRTAVGIIEPLHYVFIVSDGRTEESEGLTLYQLAKVFKDEGCATAYNLDGGGSATMWFMGKVVNKPTTNGDTFEERGVSDIVYIGE